MRYSGLDHFLNDGKATLAKGPLALIFAEDPVEIESTVRHHLDLGFRKLLLFAPPELTLSRLINEQVERIDYMSLTPGAVPTAVNALIDAAPGIWMYYCYNAEFLYFPFCETRTIGEMLAFHTEERRDAMLTYVIDLYAGNLDHFPNAVSIKTAHLDRAGYYALGRRDADDPEHMKERQLDFFGGLRWRFEEHVPPEKRKIDRISIFRAQPGLRLRADHTFNREEYNTYACPWHNNLTAAVCSFRTAKALKTNAGSMFDIWNFTWHNSVPFEWHSQQLMNLGLMEPGQWF